MFNLSKLTDDEICKLMESVPSDDEDTSDEGEGDFFRISDSVADPDDPGFPVPSECEFGTDMIEKASLEIITEAIRDNINIDGVVESSGNLSHDSDFPEDSSQILET